MIKNFALSRGIAASLALTAIASASMAETITIRRDTVVPIRFTRDITLRDARPGDRVIARVDDDYVFPRGTELIGFVRRVQRPRDSDRDRNRRYEYRDRDRNDRYGFVEIQFASIDLPDGGRQRIEAIAIPYDSRSMRRDRDGRIVIKRNEVERENAVGIGTIGGLILGKLVGKPFEGAVIGALAGVLYAETSDEGRGVVIKRNQRMAALFTRDQRIEIGGRLDYRRNDPYYGNDDNQNRPRRDDDPNYRGDDRNQPVPRPRDDNYPNDNRYGREPEIRFGNSVLRFDRQNQPYRSGHTVMVPLQEAARQMGISANIDRDRITLEGDESRSALELEVSSRDARLDGRRFILPAEVEVRDGVIYVPVEALAMISTRTIYVDGTRIEPPTL